MKHRASFIAAYICLLSLLTLGAGLLAAAPREERLSQKENRILHGFPAPGLESVLSGEFMEEFEAWLSDGFPGRDGLVTVSETIMGVFGDREEDLRQTLADQTSAAPEKVPETEGNGTTPGERADAAIWMVAADGSVHVEETYPEENLRHIAEVLEEYLDCLPEDGRILFVNTPVSMQGNAITDSGKYVDWGCSVDEVMQPMVDERIRIFDPMDILRPYLGKENLFSSYDFHWHIRSAWHVASAMLEEAGYPPIDFWEFMHKLQYEFYEAPYTPEQLQNMTPERENRLIPQKTSPLRSYIVKRMDQLSPSVYMEDDKFGGYGIYLGGRRPPMRLFETGYHTGRNALVIGDSFFHAFLPFLTPYYDSVLAIDPRDDMYNRQQVAGSIRQYMEKYHIGDIYFVFCNYDSLNSDIFQDRLERHLNTDWGEVYAWKK